MPKPFDKDPAAVAHLRAADPVMAGIIERIGTPRLRARMSHDFEALGRAILYQQLAGAAAAAIEKRFRALFSPPPDLTRASGPPSPHPERVDGDSTPSSSPGAERTIAKQGGEVPFPTPEQLLATDDDNLRGAGLSRQKLAYLRDLAAHFADGRLKEKKLHRLPDEEIIERVVRVKGIGRWSAEMFLIFQLRRPDVLPVDDLGVRNAFRRMYGLDEPPTAQKMVDLAEPWRPYRSLGTWYLWQSFDFVLMGEDNRPRTRPSE